MMMQRTLTTLILFICFGLLTGTASGNNAYAVVDDTPALMPGQFTTVQAALDSGATWIEVRPGEYGGFALNRSNVTLRMQGARFYNNEDLTIWIDVAAEGATIQGDWEIYGAGDGSTLGDNFHGTAIYNNAAHVTLQGLRCTNLIAFCVISPVATAHHVTIRDCDIRNVATTPEPPLLTGTAILFINGSSYNTVRDCRIEGQSQAIGTWYGASFNRIYDNELVNNYGWIGAGSPRSAVEDYGVPGAENQGNWFYGNRVDGSNASAFELADELQNVVVRHNEVRNAAAGFWMGGTADNKSLNATIEGNTFFGDGDDETNWFSGSGVIRGNTWHGWTSNGVGTIHVPSDGLGDVTIEGNVFRGGGMVLRSSAAGGLLRFTGNEIDGATHPNLGILYFADAPTATATIEGNRFVNITGRAVNQNAGTALTIRNNLIYGAVWAGAGSTIEGNTFYTAFEAWTPLYIQSGVIARNNRIFADNTPVVVSGSATGTVVIDNFVARQDGSAAPLPICPVGNRCEGNWTSEEP